MATTKTLYLSVSGATNEALARLLRVMSANLLDENPEMLNLVGEVAGHNVHTVQYSAFLEEQPPHPFADWYKRANYLDPDYDNEHDPLTGYRDNLRLRYQEETVYRAKSHTQNFEVVKRTDIDNSVSYTVYYTYYTSNREYSATFETLAQTTIAVEQAHGIPLVGLLCD